MKKVYRLLAFLGVSVCFWGGMTGRVAPMSGDFRPEDAWMQARLYPDETFATKAYFEAIEAERLALQLRGPASEGFDGAWRMEGPGNIGARVNALAVHPTNSNVMYAGYSRGGIFKTTNGGQTWSPIFDQQNSLNIGDITLNPSNPDEIFVGTGDLNIGGYYSVGNGLWKSADGGQTWQSLGLEQTRIISRVVVHPTDGNIIYAGTMGAPYQKNTSRGLYKSTDGGQTWQQSLFVSDSSGIIDVVMSPFDANTLYAASWNRMRSNQKNFVTGPDAKIFKTTDGGNTWTLLTVGLPSEVMGRIGLAISEQTPGLLYATYVGTDNNIVDVFRTTNGGASWQALNIANTNFNTGIMGGFGWFFGQVRINPQDDNDVFVLGVDMDRTLDGGGDWFSAIDWQFNDVHADKHDLVFAPNGDMILATDGGIYRSTDEGITWLKIENIAATQFYRVAYNPHSPDQYYGGAQDNGTLTGSNAGINDWVRIFGGDGFQARFHPDDPLTYFVEYQNGNLNVTTDGGQSYSDATFGIGLDDRKHWDFPYIISAHDGNRMYCGTQYVYRNDDGAFTNWYPISDDLTDGVVFFSSAHTISCVAESPVNENYLYAGTTDGNVWRSTDAGGSWQPIHQNGLPDRYISSVQASPDVAGRLYVTLTGYRDGEYTPHVFRSDDNGNSWADISANLPQVAVNDIYIQPELGDSLLFVGTDIGVYGSTDAGQTWERLGTNMPFVPIFDLDYNPSQQRLIAGTFARSIQSYDISALIIPPVVGTREPRLAADIYPNPVRDRLTVRLPDERAATLRIFDTGGRLLRTEPWSPSGTDVSGLPAGTFVLQITGASGRRTALGMVKQ